MFGSLSHKQNMLYDNVNPNASGLLKTRNINY